MIHAFNMMFTWLDSTNYFFDQFLYASHKDRSQSVQRAHNVIEVEAEVQINC